MRVWAVLGSIPVRRGTGKRATVDERKGLKSEKRMSIHRCNYRNSDLGPIEIAPK